MLGAILGIVSPVLDKVITDKNKRMELQHALSNELLSHETTIFKAAADVVKAEANSRHWLTATWRPITMLCFVAIVVNNYILAPYINLFFSVDVMLETPPDLWDLIKIGLGGYVVGRSAEKVAETIQRR